MAGFGNQVFNRGCKLLMFVCKNIMQQYSFRTVILKPPLGKIDYFAVLHFQICYSETPSGWITTI